MSDAITEGELELYRDYIHKFFTLVYRKEWVKTPRELEHALVGLYTDQTRNLMVVRNQIQKSLTKDINFVFSAYYLAVKPNTRLLLIQNLYTQAMIASGGIWMLLNKAIQLGLTNKYELSNEGKGYWKYKKPNSNISGTVAVSNVGSYLHDGGWDLVVLEFYGNDITSLGKENFTEWINEQLKTRIADNTKILLITDKDGKNLYQDQLDGLNGGNWSIFIEKQGDKHV